MFQLYFKHLLPFYPEWQDAPFAPWGFQESVFLSVLSFFESGVVNRENFSLRNILRCQPIFMDSGAFAAESLGFVLDPYEVAEMQALLKADLVVPLDRIIVPEDSPEVVTQKMQETLRNTEILLDYRAKESDVVGPLQGLTSELLTQMFDAYRELGITKFGLGGLVFQPHLQQTIDRIKEARTITQGYWLHLFGKFLHPYLLKLAIDTGTDAVDGFGYILSSVRGLYIDRTTRKYVSIGTLTERYMNSRVLEQINQVSTDDAYDGVIARFSELYSFLLVTTVFQQIRPLIHLRDKASVKVGVGTVPSFWDIGRVTPQGWEDIVLMC